MSERLRGREALPSTASALLRPRISLLLLVLALNPFWIGSVEGQTCAFDWRLHYEPLTRLMNEFQPASGNGDSVTIPWWFAQSSQGWRETWYIPSEDGPDKGPLYRFFNAAVADHMDRPDPGAVPASYQLDPPTPLGYPFKDHCRDGLSVIRTYLGNPFDHRTWLFSAIPSESGVSYSEDATFWPTPGPGRLGYERFGQPLLFSQISDFSTYTIENASLRLVFNRIWGNVLQTIEHKSSGKQILDPGIGDLAQSLIRFPGAPGCTIPNPTQAGGARCDLYGATEYWAGSPVVDEDLTSSELRSLIRPLDFCHAGRGPGATPWEGANGLDIFAWNGIFERTDRLGCELSGAQHDDVVLSRFRAKLSSHHSLGSQVATMENAYFVAMEFLGDARTEQFTLDWINLETGLITPIDYTNADGSIQWGDGSSVNLFSFPEQVDHALIATPLDGGPSFAVALFQGTSLPQFLSTYLRCEDPALEPSCPLQRQEIIIQARRRNSEVVRGLYGEYLDSVLVVADRATVLSRLAQLETAGGGCEGFVFRDGFESGDLSAWSEVFP